MSEKPELSLHLQHLRITLSIVNLLPISWLLYPYIAGAKSDTVPVLGVVTLINGLVLVIDSKEFRLAQKSAQSLVFLVLGLLSVLVGLGMIALALKEF